LSEHYIDLLEKKPRAVFNAKPIKDNAERELLNGECNFQEELEIL